MAGIRVPQLPDGLNSHRIQFGGELSANPPDLVDRNALEERAEIGIESLDSIAVKGELRLSTNFWTAKGISK